MTLMMCWKSQTSLFLIVFAGVGSVFTMFTFITISFPFIENTVMMSLDLRSLALVYSISSYFCTVHPLLKVPIVSTTIPMWVRKAYLN